MGDAVGKSCPPGEIWISSGEDKGCWPLPLGRKRERVIGRDPCDKGYLSTEDENEMRYCAPCQKIEYACPETGDVIQKMEVCLGGRDYYTKKTKAQVFTESIVSVLGLYERNCQIKTPGFFYDSLQKWRDLRSKGKAETLEKNFGEILESYAAQGFKQESVDGKVKIEKDIQIKVEVVQVISIEGHGDNLEAAKKDWLDKAMAVIVIRDYQVLPP